MDIKRNKKTIDFLNNKKEAFKTIKNEILYNGILTINGVQKDTLYYELCNIVDNSNKELYTDIIRVYKTRLNEYNKALARDTSYLKAFTELKHKLQDLINTTEI